jgi:hypothetical protein
MAPSPVEHASNLYELVPMRLGKVDEVPEQRSLGAKLEAERLMKIDVLGQGLAQHDAAPGQGCAICCSMTMSTLA